MDVNKIIAQNVKKLREKRKLTLDEKGDVNPTISVLWKIANGYKVSFTSIIEEPPQETVSVLRAAEPLLEDGGRYLNYPAFAFDEAKQFETYRIVIKPTYNLNTGDSIRFMANVPHVYANTGSTDAELHMLIYYNK